MFIIGRLKLASVDTSDNRNNNSEMTASIMRKTLMRCLLEVARSHSDVVIGRINVVDLITPLLIFMTDNNPGMKHSCQNMQYFM
jgi:hypothetical protein